MVPNLDIQTIAKLLAQPGQDTRQWVSYGTVEPEKDGQRSVEFTTEYGPLVNLVLHPSAIPVRARVAMQVAGNGEAEWCPFIEGDEVIVLIPEGDERAYPCIIGRLCQEIDKFPMQVAGQDATANNFAFKRSRTPVIQEFSAGWTIRNATTASSISMSTQGNITLTEGNKGYLHVGADFIGMQTGDAKALLQVGTIDGTPMVTAEADGSAKFTLAKGESQFISPGTLTLGAGGMASTEHLMTAEATVNLIAQVLFALGASITLLGPAPLTGASLGPLFALPAPDAPVPAVVAGLGTVGTSSIAPYLSLIQAALAAKQQNSTGNLPSVGCPAILGG